MKLFVKFILDVIRWEYNVAGLDCTDPKTRIKISEEQLCTSEMITRKIDAYACYPALAIEECGESIIRPNRPRHIYVRCFNVWGRENFDDPK